MSSTDTPSRPPRKVKVGPPCPDCGSINTHQTEVYEDSYGHLVTENTCDDCQKDFQKKIGGL